MFFRIKPSGGRRYLQIVENKRVDGKVRQVGLSVICVQKVPLRKACKINGLPRNFALSY